MRQRVPIPEKVKAELRAEVGYGCPISLCRSPFLTWHHFDPTYNVRPHHNPRGMIALCREHHDEADAGHWSREQLRALKKAPHSAENVKGSFPSWEHTNILVRFGGNYTGGSSILVDVNGQSLIRLERNPAGMLALSFDLHDEKGKMLLKMDSNFLEIYPTHVHDLIVAAQKRGVKLWFAKRDIGLDLTFERIGMAELDKLLEGDFQRSARDSRKSLSEFDMRRSTRLRVQLLNLRKEIPVNEHLIEALQQQLRDCDTPAAPTVDLTGIRVRDWARKNRDNADGTLPFFNFRDLSFFLGGKRLRIRNGMASEGMKIDYCSFFGEGRRVSMTITPQC